MSNAILTHARVGVGGARVLTGELVRAVAFTVVCAALVAYMIALSTGAVFSTDLSHAETCPNREYRTGPSAALPDCRAYEQVSPVKKNGGYINTGGITSSPDGETIGFTSNSGFAGATSDIGLETSYQSTRGTSGWNTAAQTQSQARFNNFHGETSHDYVDYSFGNVETSLEGGAELYLMQEVSRPEADLDFYVAGSDGVPIEVGPAMPPTGIGLPHSTASNGSLQGEAAEHYMSGVGVSADASHIVFKDPEEGPNQWSFGSPGALLEYGGTNNTAPFLVGVDNKGELVNGCPTQLLGGTSFSFNHISNPISSNGNRIFFTAGGSESPLCQGELFARVDGGLADAHTVAISSPSSAECDACVTNPGEPAHSRFFGASTDGSKVFFYTSEPLLGGSEGLYEYNFDASEGEKITKIASGYFEPNAVLDISQDGSHVYFFSESVLTGEPSPDVPGRDAQGNLTGSPAVAREGGDNLYVSTDGHIAFVATLQANDEPKEIASNVTPDGRFLVLNVHTELTRDDTSTASQVFEYDAETESMVRVSIGEGGYNNNGNTYLAYPDAPYYEGDGGGSNDNDFADSNDTEIANRAARGEQETQFLPSSYGDHLSVSEDGQYVFFLSPDGLMPGALNRVFLDQESYISSGKAEFAQNVYEYHAGHVYLISDGKDTSTHVSVSQVHLLTTDLTGRDVFFETTDPLVPQDTDSNKDIYDARVYGGFPPPAQPASCSSDACQGPLSGAPVLLSPGSAFQAGGDNPPSVPATPAVKPKPKKIAKCAKGKRLSHGRCSKAKPKKTPKKAKKASNDRRTNR